MSMRIGQIMTRSAVRRVLVTSALALAAGGCSMSEMSADIDKADRWVEKQWIVDSKMYSPERLAIGSRTAEVSRQVAFAPRSAALSPDQRDGIVAMIVRNGAGRGDSATIGVSAAEGRGLAERRAAAIASVLHAHGLRVLRSLGPEASPGVATVTVTRVVATGPDCPEWDRLMKQSVVDEYKPRLGCLTAASLAASVHRPRDLDHGRVPGNSDAQVLDKGLQSFREGKFDAKPDPVGAGTTNSGAAK